MADTPDPAGLLVQNLAWIRRVAASLCRHRGLSGDDADEFASWAILRLIDNDYAIVRKFRRPLIPGSTSSTTYLKKSSAMQFSGGSQSITSHATDSPSAVPNC